MFTTASPNSIKKEQICLSNELAATLSELEQQVDGGDCESNDFQYKKEILKLKTERFEAFNAFARAHKAVIKKEHSRHRHERQKASSKLLNAAYPSQSCSNTDTTAASERGSATRSRLDIAATATSQGRTAAVRLAANLTQEHTVNKNQLHAAQLRNELTATRSQYDIAATTTSQGRTAAVRLAANPTQELTANKNQLHVAQLRNELTATRSQSDIAATTTSQGRTVAAQLAANLTQELAGLNSQLNAANLTLDLIETEMQMQMDKASEAYKSLLSQVHSAVPNQCTATVTGSHIHTSKQAQNNAVIRESRVSSGINEECNTLNQFSNTNWDKVSSSNHKENRAGKKRKKHDYRSEEKHLRKSKVKKIDGMAQQENVTGRVTTSVLDHTSKKTDTPKAITGTSKEKAMNENNDEAMLITDAKKPNQKLNNSNLHKTNDDRKHTETEVIEVYQIDDKGVRNLLEQEGEITNDKHFGEKKNQANVSYIADKLDVESILNILHPPDVIQKTNNSKNLESEIIENRNDSTVTAAEFEKINMTSNITTVMHSADPSRTEGLTNDIEHRKELYTNIVQESNDYRVKEIDNIEDDLAEIKDTNSVQDRVTNVLQETQYYDCNDQEIDSDDGQIETNRCSEDSKLQSRTIIEALNGCVIM